MKTILIMTALLMVATMAFADDHPQTTCPIMGGAIDKTQYVDAEGYRIYVCCAGCIDTVKADPAKVIAQMKADGVEVAEVPESSAVE